MLLKYQEIKMPHGLPKYHVEICIKKLCKVHVSLKILLKGNLPEVVFTTSVVFLNPTKENW